MKLAEALALRADATRRIEQLRARIVASARFQEGEEPAEDADAAAGQSQAGTGRQLRSELKMLAALPVAQHGAQVTGHSTRHTTTCRSTTMRAGTGNSTLVTSRRQDDNQPTTQWEPARGNG